jgi:hypothetical protein
MGVIPRFRPENWEATEACSLTRRTLRRDSVFLSDLGPGYSWNGNHSHKLHVPLSPSTYTHAHTHSHPRHAHTCCTCSVHVSRVIFSFLLNRSREFDSFAAAK